MNEFISRKVYKNSAKDDFGKKVAHRELDQPKKQVNTHASKTAGRENKNKNKNHPCNVINLIPLPPNSKLFQSSTY